MNENPSRLQEFAHELRNTLSPLRSAVQLLRLRNASDEQLGRVLRTMDLALDSTLETVGRFVDAEELTSGSVTLEPKVLELSEIVATALEHARRRIDARTVHVTSPMHGLRVKADEVRTCQVVTQLLESVSLVSPADATIGISARPNAATIDLVVWLPEETPLDSPGLTLDSSRSTTHLGFGLRTARRVMEIQRGTLDARTDAASGRTAFIVGLPKAMASDWTRSEEPTDPPTAQSNMTVNASAESAATNARVAQSPSAAARILVVDDNEAVRNAYREVLEALGYAVTLAADGEEALRLAGTSVPDVVLIDIHLPKLNGYEVARQLRVRHTSRPIKLVMLSDMTSDATLERLSKDNGFDHCIDKGAGPQALDKWLRA